jgi:CheY-like chemotaxis protein
MAAVAQVSQYRPDLILLDVMMPGMDGLQTLQAIRQQPDCQHIPVVFMTARIQSDEKQQYLTAGAIAVIEKPFHAPSLGPELLEIFQQYHAHQQ